MSNKIVIVGGGYAGVLTAKKLIKKNKKAIKNGEVEITLIDKQPYHTLLTELHEVAFERTSKEAIKVYYKKVFKKDTINLVLDTVTNINYDDKKITTNNSTYEYDYLVEATGAKPAFFGVPGAEEHSLKMWSYKDAIEANKHVIDMFNRAELEPDEATRRAMLTFVVAGAGFSGVEVVGELNEWISCTLLNKYPTINPEEVNVYVIDGASRVLNSFGEKAAAKAQKKMDAQGIITITNAFIKEITPDYVVCGEGKNIPTKTVIWTSGITCEPISGETLNVERGRIKTNKDLSTEGKKDAYCLGDIMYYIPEGSEMPVPQMVENCEYAAPLVAAKITNDINNGDKEFVYDPTFHGAMACIGSKTGVAELHLAGRKIVLGWFFAMFVKHMINYVYLFSAAGLRKMWAYTKEEFFNVSDRRSFIGGHLSAKTPSIYLVPLRIWLGMYWIRQGLPKVYHKLSGGWEAICDTEVFPGDIKDYGDVCRAMTDKQAEIDFYVSNSSATPPAEIASQVEVTIASNEAAAAAAAAANDAAGTVDAATSATDATATAVDTAATAADAATAATDAAGTAADAADSVAQAADYVFNNPDTGLFGDIAGYIEHIAPTSGPYGLQYDLSMLPDFLVDFLVNTTNFMLGFMAGFEWLFEFMFDFLEFGLGLLLILGLFTSFASVLLTGLAIVISIGSLANYGMIVEGLFFSIFGALAMIGIGKNDYQPLSLDYYLVHLRRKNKYKNKK